MPLNMNTIGTGTGISGGSGSGSLVLQDNLGYQLFPNPSGITFDTISDIEMIDSIYPYPPTFVQPAFKYKNEWYCFYQNGTYSSPSLAKVKYTFKNNNYSQTVTVLHNILGGSSSYYLTGMTNYSSYVIVCGDYMYYLNAYSATYSENTLVIYRSNGKTATKVTSFYINGYSSTTTGQTEWFPMNSDGSRIFLRVHEEYSDYTNYWCWKIINIGVTGEITIEKEGILSTNFSSSTKTVQYWMCTGSLVFNSDLVMMLVNGKPTSYKLSYTRKESYGTVSYDITFTKVTQYTNSVKNYYLGSILEYPSLPGYGSAIFIVYNSSSQTQLYISAIYQVKNTADSFEYKQVYGSSSSDGVAAGSQASNYSNDKYSLSLIPETDPPLLVGDCYDYVSSAYRKYVYGITCTKTYEGEGYAIFSGNCMIGDTVYTDTGIIRVTDPDGTVTEFSERPKTYKITKNGSCEVRVCVPDSQSRPGCIIKDKYGNILNTYIAKDSSNQVAAYLISGMNINESGTSVSGFNDLSKYFKESNRVSISLKLKGYYEN